VQFVKQGCLSCTRTTGNDDAHGERVVCGA
jgi:hypothetical protein